MVPPVLTTAANITVGPAPSPCASSHYHWESDLSTPLGYIFLHVGPSGWGALGSQWNLSTGDGARLTGMAAVCSKSECPNAAAASLAQRADGSWYMTVTNTTTADLAIQGLLESPPSEASHNATTYPLHISGYPNCDTPVAQNCANANFTFDTTQWNAYKVNDFLPTYLSDRGINSFQALLHHAQNDFEPKTKVQNAICDITSPQFNCPGPDWTMCEDSSENTTTVRGVIMTKGITNFATFLNFLYTALNPVAGNLGDWIDGAVATYWNPAQTSQWSRVLNIISSVISILATGLFEFHVLAPVAASVSAAASAAGTHGFMASAIIGLILKIPKPSTEETMFKQASGYKIGAQNHIKQVQDGFQSIFTTAAASSDLASVFANGAWVSDDMYQTFTTTGNAKRVSEWYEKMMVSQYISQALVNNDFYIVFVPYDDKKRFGGTEIGFTDDDCIHHWVNNPKWKHASACGMSLGPNGPKGVALFVRPWSEGPDTKSLVTQSLNYHGHNISFVEILGSALWGHQKYGLNYTLPEKEAETMTARGLAGAATSFTESDLAFDYPGLFNLPVCVLSELSNVPGIGQIMKDIGKSQFQWEYEDPCSCSGYTYQAPDSKESLSFRDVVSDKVRKSLAECNTNHVA